MPLHFRSACVSVVPQLFVEHNTHTKSYSLCDCHWIQDLDDKRERALKGLNTTLAWLEEAIVISGMLAHALITCLSSPKSRIGVICMARLWFSFVHVWVLMRFWCLTRNPEIGMQC